MKKLSCLLSLALVLVPVAHTAAQTQQERVRKEKEKQLAQVKKKIAKLGVGEKAKATISLHNDTKVKGYVDRVGTDDFVIRDRKTDAATTINYADVYRVDDNRGHHNSNLAALIVAVGGAITVVGIWASIAKND